MTKHRYYLCLQCGNTQKDNHHQCDECNSIDLKLLTPLKRGYHD